MKARPSLALWIFFGALGCSSPSSGGMTRGTDPTTSFSGGAGASGSSSAASGGASSVGSGSGGSGQIIVVGGAAGAQNCGFQTFNLQPVPADVLLVLDRSASMQDPPDGSTAGTSKWDLVIPAVTQVITDTDAKVSWGMKSFPEGEGSECASTSVTSAIDVGIADHNAGAVDAKVMTTTPQGNGTPTGDAINAAVKYLQGVNDGHQKYILLATDGEPSCAGTTKDSTTARTFAVTAVGNALSAGFPTFVVGVATTKQTATDALNQMALAGGKPTGGNNPVATHYYLASTQDALVTALEAITSSVNNTCVFKLDPPPPAPDFIAVKVSGVTVPRDPNMMNGWQYNAADASSLQVYGSQCDAILSSADKVEIIYGCLGVVPK